MLSAWSTCAASSSVAWRRQRLLQQVGCLARRYSGWSSCQLCKGGSEQHDRRKAGEAAAGGLPGIVVGCASGGGCLHHGWLGPCRGLAGAGWYVSEL